MVYVMVLYSESIDSIADVLNYAPHDIAVTIISTY